MQDLEARKVLTNNYVVILIYEYISLVPGEKSGKFLL